jgi:lipopolysaccharide biosynthesis glycosyltransferase
MNIPHNTEAIPICYRSDKKYKHFLINSIKSTLKFYKGKRPLFFYVCTTDKDLNLLELDKLKAKYNFFYCVVQINDELISSIPERYKEWITIKDIQFYISNLTKKRFIDFKKEFHYRKNNDYNELTYMYNPFGRSKFATCCWITFFPFLSDYYDKVVLLDTDTIVVSDIEELYNTNITDVRVAFCMDWANIHTISPTNGLVNLKKNRETFFKENGMFEQFAKIIVHPENNKFVFSEEVQKITHKIFQNDCLILDKEWNVPITHKHLYSTIKIYHFSESWTGKKNVLCAYEDIVNKYLCETEIDL